MKDWKYDHLIEQLHRTVLKRHECFIISSLFHDEQLVDLLPLTQYYIRRKDNGSYALVDLFYPQINLVIEINESHHKNNKAPDRIRQDEIESKNIKVEVIDIEKKDIIKQVQELKAIILVLKEAAKKDGKWNEWKEPISINKLKDEFENTLFVKIKSQKQVKDEKRTSEEISKEIIDRQMGYWIIGEKKKGKIEKVVVVCDLVILKVFTSIKLEKRDIDGKYGYKGEEVLNCKFIGSKIKDWTTQNTHTFSNDIKSN